MPLEWDSPSEWMRYAKSDLALARARIIPGVMLEALCFHAQQAVEKAVKAVLKHYNVPFPKIHSIERLIDLLPTEIRRSSELMVSSILTEFAAWSRYPRSGELVSCHA